MTRRRVRTAIIAAALGASISIGTAALPAQANYVGSGNSLFRITTHVQDIGPVTTLGTTGLGKNLEAVYVEQLGTVRMCVEAHLAGTGWQGNRCTTGKGSKIVAGTTGQNRAIEALAFTVSSGSIGGSAHMRNLGWRTPPESPGDYYQIGTVGRGIPMEAFRLTIS